MSMRAKQKIYLNRGQSSENFGLVVNHGLAVPQCGGQPSLPVSDRRVRVTESGCQGAAPAGPRPSPGWDSGLSLRVTQPVPKAR